MLVVFHYVVAGLSFLGFAFLFMHFLFMRFIFARPDIWKNAGHGPPPELFELLKWAYFFAGICLTIAIALNFLSATFLRQRRNRIFSIVVAAIDCIQIPFGTLLGIFTIMVLSRESVRAVYEAETPPAPPARPAGS